MSFRPYVSLGKTSTQDSYILRIVVPQLKSEGKKYKENSLIIEDDPTSPDIKVTFTLDNSATPTEDHWYGEIPFSNSVDSTLVKVIMSFMDADGSTVIKETLTRLDMAVEPDEFHQEGPYLSIYRPSSQTFHFLDTLTLLGQDIKGQSLVKDSQDLGSGSVSEPYNWHHNVISNGSSYGLYETLRDDEVSDFPPSHSYIDVFIAEGGTRKPKRKAKTSTALSSGTGGGDKKN